MATASEDCLAMVENELTCTICLNRLREPKDLDCPHVFCLQCLKSWVRMKPTIECPECRRITYVPRGGLVNLKTNLRLKNMIEKLARNAAPARSRKCVNPPKCSNHFGECQQYFCVTCDNTACHKCLVENHHNHEIRKIRNDKIEFNIIEKDLKAAKEKALSEVNAHAQNLISDVEKQRDRMIANIKATFDERMKIIEEKQNRWIGPPTSTTGLSSAMGRLNVTSPIKQEDISRLYFEPGPLETPFGEIVTSNPSSSVNNQISFGGFVISNTASFAPFDSNYYDDW